MHPANNDKNPSEKNVSEMQSCKNQWVSGADTQNDGEEGDEGCIEKGSHYKCQTH